MNYESYEVARRARQLLDLNKPEAALELVVPAIASNPDNAILHALMGEALQRRDRYEEAIEAGKRVLSLDPENVYAYWLLAECFWWTNRHAEREDALRKALAIDPLHFECLTGLATILADRGDEAEAYALAAKAISEYPDRAFAWQCKTYVACVFCDWEEAERTAHKALEIDPQHPRLHHSLGWALAGQGRAEDAIASFERALELNPGDSNSGVSQAHALVFLGRYDEGHALNRRLHEAEVLKRQHEAQVNPSAVTRMRLAVVSRKVKTYEEVTAEAERAVEADPTSLRARLTLAEQKLLIGERKAALDALGEPSDWGDEEPRRLVWLVRLASYAHAPEYIAVAMPRIREMSPRHDKRRLAEAWAAMADENWAEAEAHFARELRPGAGLCCMKVGLGIACAEQGNVAKAREMAEEAAVTAPFCNCFQIRELEARLSGSDERGS